MFSVPLVGLPPSRPADTSSPSSRLFPPRGVDEDMLDKDQILLQKEAEVRANY